jgi:hypothetical protein
VEGDDGNSAIADTDGEWLDGFLILCY